MEVAPKKHAISHSPPMRSLVFCALLSTASCALTRTALHHRPANRHAARAPSPRLQLFGGLFKPGIVKEEGALLAAIDGGASARSCLNAFASLEKAAPSASNLLYTKAGLDMIDGRWVLLSTIAARVADDEALAEQGVSNAVNASGIVLDVQDRSSKPVQEVDVAAGRIGNEICFTVAGNDVIVRVAGSFEADAEVGRRANVNFDTLDVFLCGGGPARRLLRAGALFTLVRTLKPALINGEGTSTSWLDTTYLSPRVRLGRGNKGSVFTLERDEDKAGPLAAFPL